MSETSGEPAVRDPGERGSTSLADKVIEKIASRAAVDVAHAGGVRRRVAGRSVGRPGVKTSAQRDGQVTALRLEVEVEYPASARQTTRAVREHVTERVGTLCGLQVDHVDITVAMLRRPDTSIRTVQ